MRLGFGSVHGPKINLLPAKSKEYFKVYFSL
jgi:hypothetical protein